MRFLMFCSKIIFVLIFVHFNLLTKAAESSNYFSVELEPIILRNVETVITISLGNPIDDTVGFAVNGQSHELIFKEGRCEFGFCFSQKEELEISTGHFVFTKTVRPIPLWLSILPPLIAIVLALIFKEVITALFVGIFVGTSTIAIYQTGSLGLGVFEGFFRIIDAYIIPSLNDPDHLSIIVFSMLIGAMVGLVTQNGGMQGVVNRLLKYARSARSGQFITWFLGIAIFFDDYANTLVVGNTMRPITDRLRISRQKLAYIVDSTAAPITAIAFITTWIGAELSYIASGTEVLGIEETAFSIFLKSLQYSFYPVVSIFFVLFIIVQKRDFGPMFHYERKARGGEITGKASVNGAGEEEHLVSASKSFNAIVPVFVVIFGTIAGLIITGFDPEILNDASLGLGTRFSMIIGNADSYKALLWSSLGGTVMAFVLSVGQKLLSINKAVESILGGFKSMLSAITILILAWSIALITKHMHTADFISGVMVSLQVPPYFIPLITFVLGALIAFSTGSSWGTMAILYPIIIPTSWLISKEFGMSADESMQILYNVIASVLAGSVLGDHCSPISDTTILSSLASSCNHISHVRTQLPYALVAGGIAAFFGVLPAAFGISSWILFPASIVLSYFAIRFFGKKV
jgi:Na+/H+ antiporter NhaC